jgi:formamidopyrimidine-DNA glycosylase
MPELPDVAIYVERLQSILTGKPLIAVRITNVFVLRSVDPPIKALEGKRVIGISRIGKRIVIEFGDDLFLVIHLMIAGRLRWRAPDKKTPGKMTLAAFEFEHGTLFFTEAGAKRRASLQVVRGRDALAQFDRGGLEPLSISQAEFATRLRSENHTLKRSLTDPRLFGGIGNAYSDEILHDAKLSPLLLSSRISDDEIARLFESVQKVLLLWIDRTRDETGHGFPETVTAFREGMAVHGRYGKPCPVCGSPVQRIRYADNETNYCAKCQTNGRLLADRAMSRLLGDDWPRTLEEMEG